HAEYEPGCAINSQSFGTRNTEANAPRVNATRKTFGEFFRVQSQRPRVGYKIRLCQRTLSCEEQIVHLPERALIARATSRLSGRHGVGVLWRGQITEEILHLSRLNIVLLNRRINVMDIF